MKASQYGVVTSDHGQGLTDEVNKMIKQGWQPVGGVSVSADPGDGVMYAQGMVKYEQPELVTR